MITRKNGLLEERFIDPVSGKRVSVYGRTKAEINKKIAEYNNRIKKGPVINEALDEWLAKKEKEVSYKTYEGYQAPIKRIKSVMGDEHANEITPAQIQAFINNLAKRGYKRTTVQRPLDILRMTFDYLITKPDNVVKSNPTNGVRLPKNLQQESRDLAPREAIEIVKANVNHPFGLYAYFAMYSGLRDQELLALTDKDIDRKNKLIYINKALSWQPNKPVIKETKTENGIRQVILLSPLESVLPKFKGYLFSADNGESPLTQSEFRRRWNKYCREVGLATCTVEKHKSKGKNNRTYYKKKWTNTIVPYQLRHEFATFCFDAGLDPKDAADLMGHASEETTRKWYTHIKDQRRIKRNEVLENFITEQSQK